MSTTAKPADTRTELEKGFPGPWQSERHDGFDRVTSAPKYGLRRLVCLIPATENAEYTRAAVQELPAIVQAANAMLADLTATANGRPLPRTAQALVAALKAGCVYTATPDEE